MRSANMMIILKHIMHLVAMKTGNIKKTAPDDQKNITNLSITKKSQIIKKNEKK